MICAIFLSDSFLTSLTGTPVLGTDAGAGGGGGWGSVVTAVGCECLTVVDCCLLDGCWCGCDDEPPSPPPATESPATTDLPSCLLDVVFGLLVILSLTKLTRSTLTNLNSASLCGWWIQQKKSRLKSRSPLPQWLTLTKTTSRVRKGNLYTQPHESGPQINSKKVAMKILILNERKKSGESEEIESWSDDMCSKPNGV